MKKEVLLLNLSLPEKISLGNRVLDGSDLDLELIRKLLEKENIYNTYYKNFYLAGKLWFVHKKGGRIDYSKLVSLCQEAIAVEKEQRLKDDMDSYNLFQVLARSFIFETR